MTERCESQASEIFYGIWTISPFVIYVLLILGFLGTSPRLGARLTPEAWSETALFIQISTINPYNQLSQEMPRKNRTDIFTLLKHPS